MIDRRFPIGEYVYARPHTPTERGALIARIETLPARLRSVVEKLTPAQLETPYREGGWTARQVVHHLADSHTHIVLRFKYALTVDGATITSYPEEIWATLPDYSSPVELALDVIAAQHAKWAWLLRRLADADFERAFQHPENGRVTLDRALGLYAWHGDHHLAHVKLVSEMSSP